MTNYTVLGINEFVLKDKFSMAIKWGLDSLGGSSCGLCGLYLD